MKKRSPSKHSRIKRITVVGGEKLLHSGKKKGGKAERNVGGWGWCNNRSVRQRIMEGWREGTGMEE